MVCVYCSGPTKVNNSRYQKRNNNIWRRRQCQACGSIFTTNEAVALEAALLVKKGARVEPYMNERLLVDILEALKNHPKRYLAARELTFTITNRLTKSLGEPVIEPLNIAKVCAETLKAFDSQAYLRYLADHPSLQKAKISV